MKKLLLVSVMSGAIMVPVAANAQVYALLAFGFLFNDPYTTLAACQAAGNGIVGQNGSTLPYTPYSYCIPLPQANTTPLAIGGGYTNTTTTVVGAF